MGTEFGKGDRVTRIGNGASGTVEWVANGMVKVTFDNGGTHVSPLSHGAYRIIPTEAPKDPTAKVESCNCEHAVHFDGGPGHDYRAVPAGVAHNQWVGNVCADCAGTCVSVSYPPSVSEPDPTEAQSEAERIAKADKRYAMDYSARENGWATQGAADYCKRNGHATHTVDGVDAGICPRCLEVTETRYTEVPEEIETAPDAQCAGCGSTEGHGRYDCDDSADYDSEALDPQGVAEWLDTIEAKVHRDFSSQAGVQAVRNSYVTGGTYAESVTRSYDFHEFWWNHGTHSYAEVTVTWHYPDAPDESRRMRFIKEPASDGRGGYYIYNLDGSPNVIIDREVSLRLIPLLVSGSLSERWVRAFYGD